MSVADNSANRSFCDAESRVKYSSVKFCAGYHVLNMAVPLVTVLKLYVVNSPILVLGRISGTHSMMNGVFLLLLLLFCWCVAWKKNKKKKKKKKKKTIKKIIKKIMKSDYQIRDSV